MKADSDLFFARSQTLSRRIDRLEKHTWAPLVISGVLPRGFTDILAMVIIGLVGLEAYLGQVSIKGFPLGLVILPLAVSATCALASVSNNARKLRGELALLTYGGSIRQVFVGHFFRGLTCSLLALSPFIVAEIVRSGLTLAPVSIIFLGASTAGGLFYSGPTLRRLRSVKIAEHYKA